MCTAMEQWWDICQHGWGEARDYRLYKGQQVFVRQRGSGCPFPTESMRPECAVEWRWEHIVAIRHVEDSQDIGLSEVDVVGWL